ncbi:unnamed protein product [Sphagnum balticum]
MAGNIPGTGGLITPGVFDVIQTQSSGASVPGGIRVAAIIGEGATSQTIVSAAQGGGKDGLDPTYTTTNGSDGRHFLIASFPVVPNRTSIYRNGLPLNLLEGLITSPFSNKYDVMFDPSSGEILMQQAYLVDQGGLFYRVSTTNVGTGVINSLTVTDADAPAETWTIKCISVQRNAMNQPIAGTAKFIASGTVSGNVLDANGNQVVWVANNQLVTNEILSFSIAETGSTPFREGDSFVIQVSSGVLTRNDSLTATYIVTANLNAPQFLTTVPTVQAAYGQPSTSNTLALGCQLAFANGSPGVMCVQAAPAIPRRTSYVLDPVGVNALSTDVEDFIFPFPVGVLPDPNSSINIFVTNTATNVETQLLANQFPYYELDKAGQPTISEFVMDNENPPGGNSFSYTVIQQTEAEVSGFDGYITNLAGYTTQGIFGSASITFTSDYVGQILQILDAANVANNNYYLVTGVANGQLQVQLSNSEGVPQSQFPDFTNESPDAFQVIDPETDLPVGAATDGIIVKMVGTSTATLQSNPSTGLNFATVTNLLQMLLKINGSTTNDGLYNITAYNSGTNTITIQKTITTETPLRFEVIDLDNTSDYLVLNHNVVPNGNTLRVDIVDARDASFYDAGWINALAALETQEIDILTVLPRSTISVIFQNAFNHCVTMSSVNNKKERVLFMGAINGLTPANLTGAQLAAVEQLGVFEGIPNNDIATLLAGELEDIANYSVPNSFGSAAQAYRCVYFYPDQIVVVAGGNNILIDGFYIAAAAAGYLSGVSNVAIPLTNKTLSGFTILTNRQFSNLTLAQLAQAGVTTLQPVQGGGRVVWGLTTTQSGFVEEQEISIVFIRDSVAKSLRAGFLGYIGIAEDDSMVATLSARAIALLKGFISQGLITAYSSLAVARDSVDPTQWNITVQVQPTYPVNFILITVSLGIL